MPPPKKSEGWHHLYGMQLPKYNSVAPIKNSSLSEATWAEFRKYLSTYQWAFDDPQASPRKSEINHALSHRGEKGACTFQREYGKFVLRPLQSWAFNQAIDKNRKLYYVSYGRVALLYLDVDLHQVFQRRADGEAAVEAINKTRLPSYWIDSARGFNGYVKVSLCGMDYAAANKVFDRLQSALRLVLAEEGNLADVEIKGRCGFLSDDEYSWSQYGKLPIHNPKWSWDELDEFAETPTIPIQVVEKLCSFIESKIPVSVLEQHEANKKRLRQEPRIEDGKVLLTPEIEEQLRHNGNWLLAMNSSVERRDESIWICEKHLQAKNEPLATVQEVVLPDAMPKEAAPEPFKPAAQTNFPSSVKAQELTGEPDSFVRQQEALRRLSRAWKRVPTVAEALDYIRSNNLFTGTWNENLARRTARVRSILRFISQTFDSTKCGKGSVNLGKYDQWAKEKFPRGIVSRKRRGVDPNGDIVEFSGQTHVAPNFISMFLAVCEFALVVDKNQDDSLPHARAEEIWNSLYAKGLTSVRFDARKWATCRDALCRRGIVQITDRTFHAGRAMRWAVGKFFPLLDLWKQPKKKSLLEPVELAEFLEKEGTRRIREHNTLLCSDHAEIDSLKQLELTHPPP